MIDVALLQDAGLISVGQTVQVKTWTPRDFISRVGESLCFTGLRSRLCGHLTATRHPSLYLPVTFSVEQKKSFSVLSCLARVCR